MPPENEQKEINVAEILGNWIGKAQDEEDLLDRICKAGDHIIRQQILRELNSIESAA